MKNRIKRKLVLILGDQLTPDISSLRAADRHSDIILMAEVREETTYVRHHKRKIAFVLAAMRHFAAELAEDGWRVDYIRLEDDDNTGSLIGEIKRAIERHRVNALLMTEPGEFRMWQAFQDFSRSADLWIRILDDDRFFVSRKEFANWAEGRKQLRMEHFYRAVRRSTGLLMVGDKPEGGRWNFDAEWRPARSLPWSPSAFPTT